MRTFNLTLTDNQDKWLINHAHDRRMSKAGVIRELINKAKDVEKIAKDNMRIIHNA